MGRHGLNNSMRASFTHAEKEMLKSGTKKERLGRDAMRNYNACSLCLARAREPRACPEGHVFCQECIINSLLSQKKDMKRQTLLLQQMRNNEADELASARASARERVLREFEATQSGLSSKGTVGKVVAGTAVDKDARERGTKRKFDLDQEEIDRLTKEGEDEALRRTALEMIESRRAKLPNFWLPSLTPSAAPAAMKEVKLQTLCTVAKPSHPISLKTLTTIKFGEDSSDTAKEGDRLCICPVCRKALTNNVKAYFLKPCGDVICHLCVKDLCKVEGACAHCGEKVAKDGFVELKREGTGFAAGGQAEAQRFDLPFQ